MYKHICYYLCIHLFYILVLPRTKIQFFLIYIYTVSNLLENNEYGPFLVEKHDIAVLMWLDRNLSSMLCLTDLSTKQAAELYMYVKVSTLLNVELLHFR